ncbi:MAG TPA: glycosyltransferase family 2 protein [Isosphaeraceae bacterium]|nr:glycosyltransferase family 2 protein [Isosphaeraceae bacterium]
MDRHAHSSSTRWEAASSSPEVPHRTLKRLTRIDSAASGESSDSAAPELSVVIPCYNEQDVLVELHKRLSEVCASVGLSFEIVLVNDGSHDGTWPLMLDLARRDSHLVLVNLSRNHGHQLALSAGLRLCRGQRILILDADLQDPPELLPEMLQRLEAGADVVYGQRRRRAGESFFKRLTAGVFYRLIERLTDVPIPRDTGDFRLMTRRVLETLDAMPERHRFLRGMVSWVGFRQEPLLYDRQPRVAGETKYTLRKMVRFALDAITAFSIKPLTLASWCGGVGAASAAILGLWAIWKMFSGASGASMVALAALVLLVGSVQLITVGILGEYLGRMYEQVKGRPLYLIDQVVRSEFEPKTEATSPEV